MIEGASDYFNGRFVTTVEETMLIAVPSTSYGVTPPGSAGVVLL
jgi:hypothetical protein